MAKVAGSQGSTTTTITQEPILSSTDPNDEIKLAQLDDVLKKLNNFKEWKKLGNSLGIHQGKLKEFEEEGKDSADCLRGVIKEWLSRMGRTTWSILIKAIEPIDYQLACKIAGKDLAAPIRSAPGKLSIEDLEEVKAALGYFSEWNNLGLKLGLHPDLLHRISRNQHDVDDRLEEVLRKWLKKELMDGKEDPTWDQLVAAVKSIDHALSDKIKKKYLN